MIGMNISWVPAPLGRLAEELQCAPVPLREICEGPAAVMVLLCRIEEQWSVLLTERPRHLGHHGGQIACPGGRLEPRDRSYWVAARREAAEEVGLDDPSLLPIGPLSALYIPVSHHTVIPWVAYAPVPPEIRVSPDEVVRAFWVALRELRGVRTGVQRLRAGVLQDWPEFGLPTARIWGATAIILDELLRKPAVTELLDGGEE